MEIKNKQLNEVTIVSISGSIDALTAPQISEHMTGLVLDGKIKLVADFGCVDYTSSAGLRVLLGAVKGTRSKGGDLILVDVQPDVEKVLKMSGFTSIMKIFSDVDTAVDSFS
jgi:anti-sigma B factor antagonist